MALRETFVLGALAYLRSFSSSTSTQAGRYDWAKVSTTVTSQANSLPLCHAVNETPSGRLLSDRDNPAGSLTEGTKALIRVRWTRSFKILCLVDLPKLRLQDKPWVPLESTKTPQGQTCGAHKSSPRRRPTAMLTARSSSLRPHDVIVWGLTSRLHEGKTRLSRVHAVQDHLPQPINY